MSAFVAALAAWTIVPPTPAAPLSLDEVIARTVIESRIEEPRLEVRMRGWALVSETEGRTTTCSCSR